MGTPEILFRRSPHEPEAPQKPIEASLWHKNITCACLTQFCTKAEHIRFGYARFQISSPFSVRCPVCFIVHVLDEKALPNAIKMIVYERARKINGD